MRNSLWSCFFLMPRNKYNLLKPLCKVANWRILSQRLVATDDSSRRCGGRGGDGPTHPRPRAAWSVARRFKPSSVSCGRVGFQAVACVKHFSTFHQALRSLSFKAYPLKQKVVLAWMSTRTRLCQIDCNKTIYFLKWIPQVWARVTSPPPVSRLPGSSRDACCYDDLIC